MKLLYRCLLILVAASAACKERPALAPASGSSDYKRGADFYDRQNDSAYFYFNKFVLASKDSFRVAWAYNYMAIIQEDAGDYYGSQESLLASLKFLREDKDTDRYCLTSDYNELGSTSLNLKNYDAAIDYYDRALNLAKDSGSRAIALNDQAVAFEKKGQYPAAIDIYQSILAESKRSRKEYARVMTNLAIARWRLDTTYRAAPDLLMALELRKLEHDDWGLNSSYAHLADYYLRSRPDSGLLFAGAMYAMARRLGSPDDELEALQKLGMLGRPNDVKGYFVEYQRLSDSLQTARNGAKNQFALIRYEGEKNKADNLRLQKENSEKRVEILWERASIIGFALFVVWLYTLFRRRARNRLRENMLRISKKVHDEVANGIYRVMNEVQYGVIDIEQVVDRLDTLYEKSRNISDDGVAVKEEELHLTIGNLVTSICSPGIRLGIVGNERETWADVNDDVKVELPIILQELMVNMKKHSGATSVGIKFERNGNQMVIRYVDDGVGMPRDLRLGNGLTNTGNRIKSLGGSLSFDKNLPKGLRIEIHLPIV